jgi:hypothetical protein
MAYFETSDLLTAQAMKCPFCASTELQLLDLQTTFWVTCKTCSANGPSGDSPEQALEYWNWTGPVAEEAAHDLHEPCC